MFIRSPNPFKNREEVGFDSLTALNDHGQNRMHTRTFFFLHCCIHGDLTLALSPCLCLPSLQVMQVVREQIMRALTLKPNSLDQFKSRLQNLSYTEILKIRQSERMNQEDFQSRPIL